MNSILRRNAFSLLGALALAVAFVAGTSALLAHAQSAGPTCILTANPASVGPGASTTLSWTTNGADTFSIAGVNGVNATATGSVQVIPSGSNSQIYTGTVSGTGGTHNCSVVVSPLNNTALTGSGSIVTGANPNTNPSSGTSTTVPTTGSLTPIPAAGTTPAPVVVSIDASGSVLLRGTVESVSSSALMVRSWGGVWTVNSGGVGATETVPAGSMGISDFSAIRIGDFVGVNGLVNRSENGLTIGASFVRDWTTNPANASSSLSSGNTGSSSPASGGSGSASGNGTSTSSASMLPQGSALYTGTVSNLDTANGTFTLTDASGTAYSVSTDQNTTLWNTAGSDINFSSLSNGDSIRLDGYLSGSNISSIVVRDTAL